MTSSRALQIQSLLRRLTGDLRTLRLAAAVARRAPASDRKPVVFFNASTRLRGHSLNAAYSLVAAWGLRLAGLPVVHFICKAGMSRCVLGTNQEDVSQAPPCKRCIRQSRLNTAGAPAHFFAFRRDPRLVQAIATLSVPELCGYEHPLTENFSLNTDHFPAGALVLPALRWRLRVHNLTDDEPTRFLFREYILSAWNVLLEFEAFMRRTDPQAVVVFNGQFFPEATARWLARQRGIPVITHEVGLRPMTAFFTTGEATIYPIDIPETAELDARQNARLDDYLEERFQGKFSMAGVQFWPEMKGLDEAFLHKAAGFQQIVPIFTNVVFDTSQPHSSVLFPDMFTWLDAVLKVIRRHPETLFVLRAHPDEARPGKSSRESVAGWAEANRFTELPNAVFIPPDQYLSSYELIQRSKFVMIYNSTIGLEAVILGAAVLCAGRARFTPYPTVYFPSSQAEYLERLEAFLAAPRVDPLPEHLPQARRFLYYQLFLSCLPFGDFLEPSGQRGYVEIRPDLLRRLKPDHPSIATILDGLLHGGDFLLKE